MAPPGAAAEEVHGCLPLDRLTAGQGDVAQVEHRERVGLRVEDPALQRHQVVAGEQQVQIPEGGGAGRERCVCRGKEVVHGGDGGVRRMKKGGEGEERGQWHQYIGVCSVCME